MRLCVFLSKSSSSRKHSGKNPYKKQFNLENFIYFVCLFVKHSSNK